MSQTRPVPPGRVRGSRPAAVSCRRDQLGGAALGPAELRYGVERTTPGDDVGARAAASQESSQAGTAARAEVGDGGFGRSASDRCAPRARSPDTTAPGGRSGDRVALTRVHSSARRVPCGPTLWCIYPWCSPGRRCTNRNELVHPNPRRGVADLLRAGRPRRDERSPARAIERSRAARRRSAALIGTPLGAIARRAAAATPSDAGYDDAEGRAATRRVRPARMGGCHEPGRRASSAASAAATGCPRCWAAARWAPCGPATTRCCSAGWRSRS